jgi:histone deacetylase 1/2
MNKKITYLFNDKLTSYEFSKDHFMKPRRIKMCHSLVGSLGLFDHMLTIESKAATPEEMTAFHHPHYIKYLESWVAPPKQPPVEFNEETMKNYFIKDSGLGAIFKVNQILDCPGFEGLFPFCQLAAGSSLDAADSIMCGLGDIVINWSGGYHHAKKSEASGFCYVNDIVLCILELLKMYNRVLYLDIDVHHGDGVEEAFYNTNRVMTVSFHQHEPGFFPGTGSIESIGEEIGKYFTINVPLKKGIDDNHYSLLFKEVMDRVMGSYRPDVVVVQSGADSLSKDILGSLNLSIKGHAECLNHMKSYNVPLILLGGGGYTVENVSRCWAYETGQMLGQDIGNDIPPHDPFSIFYLKDDKKIHFEVDHVPNLNSKDYLNKLLETIT